MGYGHIQCVLQEVGVAMALIATRLAHFGEVFDEGESVIMDGTEILVQFRLDDAESVTAKLTAKNARTLAVNLNKLASKSLKESSRAAK